METSKSTIPARGLFIAVEGPDGSGKSTWSKVLAGMLHERLGKTHLTHEVGGTPIGAAIRKIAFNAAEEIVDPQARLLMLYAARLQHIVNVIRPHLAAGTHVVTDRYKDSTAVYQGHIDNQLRNMRELESCPCMASLNVTPDITVYLVVDAQTAWDRCAARVTADNTVYKLSLPLTRGVVDAYEAVMEVRSVAPDGGELWRIDATRDRAAIQADLLRRVVDLVARRGGEILYI